MVESLLGEVRRHVPGGARLLAVRLEVGRLEHLDGEVLRLLWQSMAAAEFPGSCLEIATAPVRVRCAECGLEHEPEDAAFLLCPRCGAARPEILGGDGILLRSLEIDEDGPPGSGPGREPLHTRETDDGDQGCRERPQAE